MAWEHTERCSRLGELSITTLDAGRVPELDGVEESG